MSIGLQQPPARSVLWIGGAQWAGKTAIARILAERWGLRLYSYDYHDARGHSQRAQQQPELYPNFYGALRQSADQCWVHRTPAHMATSSQRIFEERFRMTLDDISQLPPKPPILAEGWGLRPSLVAPLLDSSRRAIFLVPTEEFRSHQLQVLPRAAAVGARTTDPDRAQRNRVERDRLLAADVVETARTVGLRTILVDGAVAIDEVAAQVEEHFRPFLGQHGVQSPGLSGLGPSYR
jgi:hypothetical protein